mmetsp:Transcript_83843/g.211134  ORF Transcript_83843/g.211134 Transcript_83843/m.211134 type:complete len:217 (+) Transcript_83843:1953-2603(+)
MRRSSSAPVRGATCCCQHIPEVWLEPRQSAYPSAGRGPSEAVLLLEFQPWELPRVSCHLPASFLAVCVPMCLSLKPESLRRENGHRAPVHCSRPQCHHRPPQQPRPGNCSWVCPLLAICGCLAQSSHSNLQHAKAKEAKYWILRCPLESGRACRFRREHQVPGQRETPGSLHGRPAVQPAQYFSAECPMGVRVGQNRRCPWVALLRLTTKATRGFR